MRGKLVAFGVVLLVAVAILEAAGFSKTSVSTASGISPLQRGEDLDKAQVEFKRAIVAVREAEAAGADQGRLKDLVDQLNLVLSMIDRGRQLFVQGDVEGAVVQARRSIEISTRLVSEAGRLRDESAQRTYYGRIFTFAMVPVASLLVTVAAHYGWIWWCRREVDRMMRMEIRTHLEPEEEKQ